MRASPYTKKEIKINGEPAIIYKTVRYEWVGYFKKDVKNGIARCKTASTKAVLLRTMGYNPKPRVKKPLPEKTELFKKTQQLPAAMMDRNNCGVISLCLSTGESYEDAQAALQLAGRKIGDGTRIVELKKAIDILGFKLEILERPEDCKTIRSLEENFKEKGSYIIDTAEHVCAMIDGVVHDWSRGRLLRVNEIWKIEKA
jgi:hypothetical protein